MRASVSGSVGVVEDMLLLGDVGVLDEKALDVTLRVQL